MPLDKDTVILITAIAGASFGLLGAVLGVLNTWRAFDRDRIRVRVEPAFFIRTNGVVTERGYRLTITNLSYIPVTITQTGFTLRDGKNLLTFVAPIDCTMPKRMEARTRFTASILENDSSDFLSIKRAYADTACGKRFTGSCRTFLRELRRRAASAVSRAAVCLCPLRPQDTVHTSRREPLHCGWRCGESHRS